MSQHWFETTHENRPIKVVIGWDRPLHYAFMFIQRLDSAEGEDEDLYSTLSDSEVGDVTFQGLEPLGRYRQILKGFGIEVPASLFDQTRSDHDRNVGNRIVRHAADGTFQDIA